MSRFGEDDLRGHKAFSLLLEAFDAEVLGADGLSQVRNDAVGARAVLVVCRTTSRLRKNYIGALERRWPVRLGQEATISRKRRARTGWLLWFVWLNQTNQMNETSQMNQIDPPRRSPQ